MEDILSPHDFREKYAKDNHFNDWVSMRAWSTSSEDDIMKAYAHYILKMFNYSINDLFVVGNNLSFSISEYDFSKKLEQHLNALNFNSKGDDNLTKPRCCGRCDGINDLCVSDTYCDNHNTLGCEDCFGKR